MDGRIGLTAGEAFWLARRRRAETQTDAALRLGVSTDRLADWERDRGTVPRPLAGRILEGLTVGEFLSLWRRRKGWSAARAARWAGVSRLTYLKAEADRTSSAARFARRIERGAFPGPSAATVLRVAGPRL